MSANSVDLWPIWSHPEARSQMHSQKFTFSLTVNLLFTKTENRTKKATHSHTIALSKGTIFVKKNPDFLQKMLTSAKLREPSC